MLSWVWQAVCAGYPLMLASLSISTQFAAEMVEEEAAMAPPPSRVLQSRMVTLVRWSSELMTDSAPPEA